MLIKQFFKNKKIILNKYYVFDELVTHEDLHTENYKNSIGKKEIWEIVGKKQLNMLIDNGMSKNTNLLDVGCGMLRAGAYFIDFLEPFRYYGLDVNKKYLEIGVNNRLKDKKLLHKVCENNFLANEDFDINIFETKFSFGIAHSVFTYLPINKFELFLQKSYDCFEYKGKFVCSFWVVDEEFDLNNYKTIQLPNNKLLDLYAYKSPYYTKKSVINQICQKNSWGVKELGECGFKWGQSFFLLERL